MMRELKYLIVSDRAPKNANTDFLANAFVSNYTADIVYTCSDLEKPRILDRILHKLGIQLDRSDINKRLIEKVKNQKYDVVLIWKGNRICPSTLMQLRKLHATTIIAAWCGDNMTKSINRTWSFKRSLNLYDVIFTVNIPDYKRIEAMTKATVYYYDKRADRNLHFDGGATVTKKNYDVLFIGTYEYARFKILNQLASNGIKVTIFGNRWERCLFPKSKYLDIKYKEVVGLEYVNSIKEAKITLGFLRKINNDTQTSRTFEIPACGGFMLMQKSDDHLRIFKEDVEASFFSTTCELVEKVKFYLNEEDLREKIASNGKLKILSGGYFFENLAAEINLDLYRHTLKNE